MIHVIIMAGGSGTRFWPLSKPGEPKQFLKLPSGKTMLENVVNDVSGLKIKRENIYIAVNEGYAAKTAFYLKKYGITGAQIISEPSSRNNFAPISVITSKIYSKDKEAVVIVLPCDNYVKYTAKFITALKKALSAAQKDYIATLGFIPHSPETGYGYIKVKSKIKIKKSKIWKVDKFIEKPSLKRAKQFLKNGGYYWNGGIFVFKAQVFLDEVKRFMPGDYRIISKITGPVSIKKFWSKFSAISIDYAIMEKTDLGIVIPVDFGWVDLGNWKGLAQLYKSDKNGNVLKGKCVDIDSKDIISWSSNRMIATLGLKDVIIVDAEDALLVCAKDRAQDVKKIVSMVR